MLYYHYLIERLGDGRWQISRVEIDESVSPPTFESRGRISTVATRSEARSIASMLAGWRGKVFIRN